MTSHSSYAKEGYILPMQVWQPRHPVVEGEALVLSVHTDHPYNQVRYLKLTGEKKGRKFYATFNDFNKYYDFVF